MLQDIMTDNVIALTPGSTYKEAREMFARYDFRAIPLCDKHHKLLGAVTYKDLMQLKQRFLE